ADPKLLREFGFAHARSDHAAETVIVTGLIKQEQQIGLNGGIVEQACVLAELGGKRAPGLGAGALDEIENDLAISIDAGGGAGREGCYRNAHGICDWLNARQKPLDAIVLSAARKEKGGKAQAIAEAPGRGPDWVWPVVR